MKTLKDEQPKIPQAYEVNVMPCPFCGGGGYYSRSGGMVWIACDVCGARTEERSEKDDGVKKVFQRWNMRKEGKKDA